MCGLRKRVGGKKLLQEIWYNIKITENKYCTFTYFESPGQVTTVVRVAMRKV